MSIKGHIGNLFGSTKAFDPALRQFQSIDRNSLEKELKIESRAESAGKADQPPASFTEKDSIATEIDAYLIAVVRRGKDDLQDHLTSMADSDSVRSIDNQFAELRKRTLETFTDLFSKCRDGVNELYQQRREVSDGELDYENFKAKNGLTGPAVYPINRGRSFMWIFFALVVEAIFNAISLGRVHPGAIQQAAYETIFIAVLNVGLGYFVGHYLWRNKNHVKKLFAFFSFLGATLIVLGTFVCHFIVGHYRQALSVQDSKQRLMSDEEILTQHDTTSVLAEVAEIAFSPSFLQLSLEAGLLTLVGILLFFLAAYKAYTMDDRYPGYGDKDRNKVARSEKYTELFGDLQEELTSTGKGANEALKDIFIMAETSGKGLERNRQALSIVLSKYETWVAELKAVGAALYALYREVNCRYRNESVPPAFNIPFAFPEDSTEMPSLPPMVAKGNIEDLRSLMDVCLTTVNEATNGYLAIYQTIGELAPQDLKDSPANAYDDEVEQFNIYIQELAVKRKIALPQGSTA